MQEEKYRYPFTVDSINDLVIQGKSFREAHKEIGEKVQKGAYKPADLKSHTHTGSKDKLSLEEILRKEDF